jgi:hypothetical protein
MFKFSKDFCEKAVMLTGTFIAVSSFLRAVTVISANSFELSFAPSPVAGAIAARTKSGAALKVANNRVDTMIRMLSPDFVCADLSHERIERSINQRVV